MMALMVMEMAKRWIKCSNLEKEEREKQKWAQSKGI
jgi:hypothetical protein